MELQDYLDRIGFSGTPRPDRATLDEVQRRHHLAIPYETLDVALGRPVTTAPEEAFDKIVRRGRGGWCYEMNGLMGWALGEIGFDVTRLAGAVMRSAAPEANLANHLMLLVNLPEGPVMADVGLGDGPFLPYPIAEGGFSQGHMAYRIERLEDGWWRVHAPETARPPQFDFHTEVRDEAAMSARCAWLQGDPASMFVQNLIIQRYRPDAHFSLLGRVLRRRDAAGFADTVLPDPAAFTETLSEVFGLDEPAAAGLWPWICERHEAVFQAGDGGS